jgi:threonine dehydrogenase-like Zn-dependent dehydrogenase
MKALVFGVPPQGFTAPADANELARRLAVTPVALHEIPDARPLRPDWVVARPILTGICGSDSKQILLDFGDGRQRQRDERLLHVSPGDGSRGGREGDRARAPRRAGSTSVSAWC